MSQIVSGLLLAAASVGWGASAKAVEDEYVEFTGTAYARHAQNVLYNERHVLLYHGGKLVERRVLYTCADGAAFAHKTVSYAEGQAPDFFFEDASNGMQEGVRSGAERRVFFKANRLEAEKSAPLPRAAELVVDAAFDDFVQAQWNTLMTGAPLSMRFLIPSRLDAPKFEVQHLRTDDVDGAPAEVFRLQLAGMLGMVLPAMEAAYDSKQHVLVRFEGFSDLRDAAGSNFQSSIEFHVKDRRASSAHEFATAERTKIEPCR